MPKMLDATDMCGTGVIEDLTDTFDGECIITGVAMAVEVIDPKGQRHMCTYWDEDSSLSTSVGLSVIFHKAAMDAVREIEAD